MALYFPDEYIQEIIEKNDIVGVVSSYVNLKRSGSTMKGLCPFHKEKTPSFSVSPDKQLFYCFGCGKGGTVINFTMFMNNLDFVEAVTMLAEKSGMELPEESNTVSNNSELRQTTYKINSEAGRYFYDKLMADGPSPAKEYIKQRGLIKSTVNHFGLGFAPGGNSLLPYLRSKGYTDEQIIAAGLAGKSENGDVYDRFRNRLMFPIIDVRKNIIGFGGRVLDDSKPKYLNTPDTVAFNKSYNLFGLNFAKNSNEKYFVLVEGYMDVISLHQQGITTAVATLGTALTPEQARLIKRMKAEVVIAYDSDEAGQNATRRAIEILGEEDITVKVLTMPGAKDPDEYIKANGAGAFKELIANAQVQIEYKINKLKEKYDLTLPDEKLQYLNAIAAEFVNIKSPVEREIYIKKISDETGISVESITSEVARLDAIRQRRKNFPDFRQRTQSSAFAAKKPETLKLLEAQKILLNLMCYNDKAAVKIIQSVDSDDFEEGAHRTLFEIIRDFRKNGAVPDGRIIVSANPHIPEAAAILHDDKNIENDELALSQALNILLMAKKKRGLLAAFRREGASKEELREEINKLMESNTEESGSDNG